MWICTSLTHGCTYSHSSLSDNNGIVANTNTIKHVQKHTSNTLPNFNKVFLVYTVKPYFGGYINLFLIS
jgi:hypothetical protein